MGHRMTWAWPSLGTAARVIAADAPKQGFRLLSRLDPALSGFGLRKKTVINIAVSGPVSCSSPHFTSPAIPCFREINKIPQAGSNSSSALLVCCTQDLSGCFEVMDLGWDFSTVFPQWTTLFDAGEWRNLIFLITF